MTIQAQISTPTSGSFPGDPHTHRMQAEYLISTDCYALLDHRTRGRTTARGDRPRVLDDPSPNGPFVTGRPFTVSYLADGDVLRLAGVVMRFVEVAPQI